MSVYQDGVYSILWQAYCHDTVSELGFTFQVTVISVLDFGIDLILNFK